MSANLEKVIEAIKALPPDEQRRVKELVDSLVDEQTMSPEDLLAKRLLEAGVISHIPPRNIDESDRTFRPVEVKGKPVSETIIEERR
ncbi:MAG: hypothetical protein AB1631_20385 [Acidobacteriota bacterium]